MTREHLMSEAIGPVGAWSLHGPVITTVVWDSLWRFAAERQEVYLARVQQRPRPWTSDPILSTYKFTNTYRAADRVSQYLIRNVIYQTAVPTAPEDVFFRIMLFKTFNKISTWELLERDLGPITAKTYRFEAYNSVLTRALQAGQAIYSNAYIMPSSMQFGHPMKHRNHLVLLERMMRESVCARLGRAHSMRDAFAILRAFPGVGDFLAYQYVTDINYSELTDYSEKEFVVPGPGARDGIRKAIAHSNGVSDADIVRLAADRQQAEFDRLGLTFRNLFGRPLHYIDCQSLFCEIDKYSRVAHPECKGKSGRHKIKQRYVHSGPLPEPWFPPKWNLNSRIGRETPRGQPWS
jgi:hypothetical protein